MEDQQYRLLWICFEKKRREPRRVRLLGSTVRSSEHIRKSSTHKRHLRFLRIAKTSLPPQTRVEANWLKQQIYFFAAAFAAGFFAAGFAAAFLGAAFAAALTAGFAAAFLGAAFTAAFAAGFAAAFLGAAFAAAFLGAAFAAGFAAAFLGAAFAAGFAAAFLGAGFAVAFLVVVGAVAKILTSPLRWSQGLAKKARRKPRAQHRAARL